LVSKKPSFMNSRTFGRDPGNEFNGCSRLKHELNITEIIIFKQLQNMLHNSGLCFFILHVI